MNTALAEKAADDTLMVLTKADPGLPVFEALGLTGLAIKAGTIIALAGQTVSFRETTQIDLGELIAGDDYVVGITQDGAISCYRSRDGDHARPWVIGGFHFAPGGNAAGRSGGDDVPAINLCSVWDRNFRPICANPGGMAFVAGSRGATHVAPFWMDIYLLAQDHLVGTSRHGVTIADGRNRPKTLDGAGSFDKLDFATAKAVLAHHGKSVPSLDEFFAAAYGVTERQAAERRAEITGIDAARTSGFGLMQAAGQRYVWGHDGDPDEPRASIFGGRWGVGGFAGSRCALVEGWPGHSHDWLGARGRSDHLQLA